MDVKSKILQNIRTQATAQAEMRELEAKANSLSTTLSRLSGQMEMLAVFFLETEGVDLNKYMAENDEFRKQVQEASSAGQKIAQGTTPPETQPAPPKPATQVRTGNKTVDTKPSDPPAVSQRHREPPKIIVTDDPVTPDVDDED